MLTIPDQWIILALDENTGKLKLPRSVFECGITGGMLLELAIASRIGLYQGNKIKALDTSPMDDPFLTKALGVIAKAKKPHTILNWMIQLSMQDSRVIESFYFKKMVEQLFLKKKSHKALGIFSSKRYFPASSDIRSEILQSLTKLIRMKTQKEIRTLCLFGLIAGSNQSDTILGGDEASVLSQYSISILSTLEEKNASTEFIPFFHSVLEAFSLSQRPAGDY